MTRPPDADFFALLHKLPRSRFAEACPHPFLVGDGDVATARGKKTISFCETDLTARVALPVEDPEPAAPLLLAVRKARPGDPDAITLGRTDKNDIVVPDASVSRAHAFFRVTARGYELHDAGAKNGTFAGKRPLAPGGPGYQLSSGDRLRFGRVRLQFLDAAACWDRLRDLPDW